MKRGTRRQALRRRRHGRDSQSTRDRILAAATTLFAQRAAANQALINYYFGSKRKLYLTIFTVTFSEIVERIERLAAEPRPAPEQLREFVALVGEMATERRPHFPALMLREVLTGGTHLDGEVLPYLLRVLAAVRRIIERGVQAGALRPVDPLLTHLSLVGSLLFFFATAAFRARMTEAARAALKTPTASDFVRHVQELITRGLAADVPSLASSSGRG
jgi:TetR/AcrR family transcriptional regulator